MNLTKIIEMQRVLDKSIIEAHNIDPNTVRREKIIALIVELGEFANEYSSFKYWKKNKKINRDDLVEEFVDGIHFITSLMIDSDNTKDSVEPYVLSDNLNAQLQETIEVFTSLFNNINNIDQALSIYLGNAELLGISGQEIEEFYVKKNKINFERIQNNY